MWRLGETRGSFGERGLLLTSAAALYLLFAVQATAQTLPTVPDTETRAEHMFTIPAQPLNEALAAFSAVTGLQVVFDARLGEGRRTVELSGRFTHDAALQHLLAGTGLRHRFTASDTVTLLDPQAAVDDGPIEAGPLLIEGGSLGTRRSAIGDMPFITPGSSAYISREQIQRIQPSSPGDIFKETPGVLSGASNDGTSINVNIRSSQGLNRVRTMVEGTQQESSGYQGYAGADQRSYVDPELISGVEISKGPGGGPYSTGTTAGVVNIRLLAADDLISEGRNTGFRLRGGLGGNAITPRFLAPEDDFNTDRDADTGLVRGGNDLLSEDNWLGSFAGAYRTDRFDLVAAYARRKEGNYFAGEHGPESFTYISEGFSGPELEEERFSPIEGGEEVPNTSEDTESVLLKGTLRLGDGQSLEAGYTYYDSRFGQVFPSNINIWAPQQYALNEVESNRYWLRYKWVSGNGLINLQANIWGTNTRELGELRQGPQDNDAWGVEIWNTSFVDTGFGDLVLTYGAEYSKSNAVIDVFAPLIGIRYTVGQSPTVTEGEVVPSFEGSREVYGAYLNAEFRPTDWLRLNAGLRYDGFDGESTEVVGVRDIDDSAYGEELQRLFDELEAAALNGDFLLVAQLIDELNALPSRRGLFLEGFEGQVLKFNENGGERFSPRFGVTVEPIDGLQLFGQYSEGFRALSLVELGQTFNGPVIVNPDLEPEVVKTWEFGVNYLRNGVFFKDDALRTKLVYFNNDYDNFVTRTGTSGSQFFFENVSDVTVSGYEASLVYDIGADRMFVDFNFSAFDQPFDVPTQASIDQPEYMGTLTVGTRWFEESLVLGARLNAFGEPNEGSTSVFFGDEFFFWSAQEIVDVFGSYAINDDLAVGFSVENAADRFYNSPLFVSRIPAPGRTLRMTFTATF